MADYEVQNNPELVDDTINKVQNLEQETGQATDKIMSQKATTDMLFDSKSSADMRVNVSSTATLKSYANNNIRICATEGDTPLGDNNTLIGGQLKLATLPINNDMNATAIGIESVASAEAVALGYRSIADIIGSVVVGSNSSTKGGITIGTGSRGLSNNIVIGNGFQASDNSGKASINIGHGSKTNGDYSVAIGQGSIATGDDVFSVGSHSYPRKIVCVANPTDAQDAATKNYVDLRVPIPPTEGGPYILTCNDGNVYWSE